MKLKMVLLAAAAVISTPASAVSITYTLSGQFAGLLNGNAFDIAAVFTGVGDTDNYTNFGSYSQVQLSSLSALAGGTTYTLVGPFAFFNNPGNQVAGFTSPTLFDILDFGSPSFATYDPRTSIGPVGVTEFYTNSFATDQGAVTLNSATGLSFSASRGSDPTGAVPEPATWALMLVGFGGMGYAMRRNRKVAVSFG